MKSQSWNRLPTLDNLRKRLQIPVEEWMCECCGEMDESSHHIFLECPAVQTLWHKIIQWCGISWPPPRSICDHFTSFSEALGGGKLKYILGGLQICVVWVIWKWRNSVKFKHTEWNFRHMEEEIKCRFWSQCLARGEAESNCSFEVWNRRKLCDIWV